MVCVANELMVQIGFEFCVQKEIAIKEPRDKSNFEGQVLVRHALVAHLCLHNVNGLFPLWLFNVGFCVKWAQTQNKNQITFFTKDYCN